MMLMLMIALAYSKPFRLQQAKGRKRLGPDAETAAARDQASHHRSPSQTARLEMPSLWLPAHPIKICQSSTNGSALQVRTGQLHFAGRPNPAQIKWVIWSIMALDDIAAGVAHSRSPNTDGRNVVILLANRRLYL